MGNLTEGGYASVTTEPVDGLNQVVENIYSRVSSKTCQTHLKLNLRHCTISSKCIEMNSLVCLLCAFLALAPMAGEYFVFICLFLSCHLNLIYNNNLSVLA